MNSTTLTEYFTFEGPIHVSIVVGAACMILALFVWSLRREIGALGTRIALLFAVLRMTSLFVAFWMLLAPAMFRSEKTLTRQAVALLVDVSPSMLTVDPPATNEDARWAPAADVNAAAAADRALAAAILAERRLADATNGFRSQQPERNALRSAEAAHDAIQRIGANTRDVLSGMAEGRGEGDDTERELAQRILQILSGSEFDQLARLAAGVRRGQDSFPAGWRESLVDLEYQATQLRKRAAELSQRLAQRDRKATTPAIASAPDGAIRKTTRLARVATFVDSLEASLLKPLREKTDVRPALFDSDFTPLPDGPLPDGQGASATWRALAERSATSLEAGASSVRFPATDLTSALERLAQIRKEQPLAAVFLFTDAAHNRPDGRDPRAAAADLSGSPVYVVPIGSTRHVRDVDLKAVSAPSVVMKGDDVVIEATLQAFACEGESIQVELRRDGQVIQERALHVDSPMATERVRFHANLDRVGQQRFQVRVVPLEGELSEENNFDQFEVNVTRDQIRILLADELPRWEYRYLAQLFRRDAKVTCDELLFRPRLLATGHRAESKAFPVTEDDWGRYDVVLLGDVSSQHLSVESQASLTRYVRERGGTLVLIAGDEAMPQAYVNQPLEDLLPVTRAADSAALRVPNGFSFQVTKEGWKHDALMIADTQESTRIAWDFINRNAPFFSLSPYRNARPSARTLIAAAPRTHLATEDDSSQNALLCWQPLGRGRVVYLSCPETYRLRFLRGDRLHYRLWGQLLRWAIANDLAAGSQRVSIRTDRPEYRFGDQVEVVVRLRDEGGNAVVGARPEATGTAEDGSRIAISLKPDPSEPGRYVGTFDHLPTGIYSVEPAGDDVVGLLASASADGIADTAPASGFTVRSPINRELLDTRSDRALAQQIADATGGQVIPPTAVGEILALTNVDPVRSESTETVPLWVQWKFLWIVFGSLFTEWAIRKQIGVS